jgi:hypothetical protein
MAIYRQSNMPIEETGVVEGANLEKEVRMLFARV